MRFEITIDESEAVKLRHFAAAIGMSDVDLLNEKLALADAIIAAVVQGQSPLQINSDFLVMVTKVSKNLAIGQLISVIKIGALMGIPLDAQALAEDEG